MCKGRIEYADGMENENRNMTIISSQWIWIKTENMKKCEKKKK